MRMLHTMLRVGDLKKSLEFYQDVLGDAAAATEGLSRRAVYVGFRRLRQRG